MLDGSWAVRRGGEEEREEDERGRLMESSVCCWGSAGRCHRRHKQKRGADTSPTSRGYVLVPRVALKPGMEPCQAVSPGLQVEDFLRQVAGALEQHPDLQGHKVAGEAAGGGHEGLPSQVQRCGTHSQEQVHGALCSASPRPGDEQGAAVLRPPRSPRHLRQRARVSGDHYSQHPPRGVDKGDTGTSSAH